MGSASRLEWIGCVNGITITSGQMSMPKSYLSSTVSSAHCLAKYYVMCDLQTVKDKLSAEYGMNTSMHMHSTTTSHIFTSRQHEPRRK